jgi:lipopolysaccharide export LptBFGC system permease protein LptF
MLKNCLFILFLFIVPIAQAQQTAYEILQKSIKTHDPRGRWQRLKAEFDMSIIREKQADRFFTVVLNVPKKQFAYQVKTDTLNYAQGFNGNNFEISFNKSKDIPETAIKKYDLTQTRTQYLREVYEYLLLLPMRLQNDAALLSKDYTIETFNNITCYKLTIQYEPVSENETWHFFIDNQSFILRGYQFYVKDKTINGEYIYLEDYTQVKSILMPKTKKWYWNKDNSFFRTDRILRVK